MRAKMRVVDRFAAGLTAVDWTQSVQDQATIPAGRHGRLPAPAAAVVAEQHMLRDEDAMIEDAAAQGFLSEEEARSLAEPAISLYANASDESERAVDLLIQSDVSFQVIASLHAEYPTAVWNGMAFNRLDGVQDLVTTLQQAGDALVEEYKRRQPDRYAGGEARLADWMRQLRERQVAEARTVMRDLQAAGQRQGVGRDRDRDLDG